MTSVPAWLIAASFMLNLALGGFIAGNLLRGQMSSQASPGQGTAGIGRPGELLSPADRQEVRRLLRDATEAASGELSQRRQAERRLVQALSGEPFDEAGARAAFTEVREADAALRDRIGTEVLTGLSGMSPQQRRIVGLILSRAGERERRRPGRSEGPGRPGLPDPGEESPHGRQSDP